jgi:hypothetical protein
MTAGKYLIYPHQEQAANFGEGFIQKEEEKKQM